MKLYEFTIIITVLKFCTCFAFQRVFLPRNILVDRQYSVVNSEIIEKIITPNLKDINSKAYDGAGSTFIRTVLNALNGNHNELRELLNEDSVWENPYLKAKKQSMCDNIHKMAGFVERPSILYLNSTLVDSTTINVKYQLSFSYPLPWRPRVIIPGCATVSYTNSDFTTIAYIKEEWDVSPLHVLFKQLPPRAWDIWHVFSSFTPEYVPMKSLGSIDGVTIVEIPEMIAVQVSWRGLSKYPGPPLFAIPGFGLFGNLRTSRLNREEYQATLPIEVQSGKYFNETCGEEMKVSSWIFNVPSSLIRVVRNNTLNVNQLSILDEAYEEKHHNLNDDSEFESMEVIEQEAEEVPYEDTVDFQIGYDLTKKDGDDLEKIANADVQYNQTALLEFELNERIDYKYRMLPKRYIAKIDTYGEIKPKQLSIFLNKIKSSVLNTNEWQKKIGRKIVGLRSAILEDISKDPIISDSQPNLAITPVVGFQLWNIKCCFNTQGEPGMAFYEMQYNLQRSSVFLEIDTNDDV